jgi:hypothetical protein
MAAGLAALIAVTGMAGAIVAALQHPHVEPPRRPPATTPFSFPTITPTPAPGLPLLGFGFSVASDPAAHQIVVFGGVDSYDTTWLWDGARWSLARPLISPAGRFGAAAAYDPAARVVMLFGGRLAPGQLANDTWTWNGVIWREINAGGNGPNAGEGAVMAWDDALRQMVLVTPADANGGSETWMWAGSQWVLRPGGTLPGGAFGIAMSFDPLSRSLLFVSTQPQGAGAVTWQWRASGWHELRAGIDVAPAGLAVDPATGRLMLLAIAPGSPSAQLWNWTGANWIALPKSQLETQPEAVVGDLDRGRLLILGSLTQPNQGTPQPLEVWWWSPHGWLQLDATAR